MIGWAFLYMFGALEDSTRPGVPLLHGLRMGILVSNKGLERHDLRIGRVIRDIRVAKSDFLQACYNGGHTAYNSRLGIHKCHQ